jgi:hypothetical protein
MSRKLSARGEENVESEETLTNAALHQALAPPYVTKTKVLQQTQLLQYLATFLNNKEARMLTQTVPMGANVSLEHMRKFACLSSPDLARKLEALLELRVASKSLETLRMMSVIFTATYEREAGAWTDTLAVLSRFSHLEYLEICVQDANGHSFPTRHVEDVHATFHSLPYLLSLAFNRRNDDMTTLHVAPKEVLRDENGQWAMFAKAVTRHAQVQHLSLMIDGQSAIAALVRLHAAHLVSLRTNYAPRQPLPKVRFLRLLYQEPDSYNALFRACPALEVLWCPMAYSLGESLTNILAAAATSAPHLHTLVALIKTSSVDTTLSTLPVNHTIRQLFFQVELARKVIGVGFVNDASLNPLLHALPHLMRALPRLHTYVVAPLENAFDMHNRRHHHQGDILEIAAEEEEEEEEGKDASSRLQQVQPLILSSEPARAVLPDESHLAHHAHVYVPKEYIEHIRNQTTSSRSSSSRAYQNRMGVAPTWLAWEAHIGKQLIDAGLSIMSPCGSCGNSRPGMFNILPLDKRKASKLPSSSSSSSKGIRERSI